jgi:hypothetical protein
MFDPAAPVADYALLWPPTLFRLEASSLARRAKPTVEWYREADWLLEDAFVGEAPVRDLHQASSTQIVLARQPVAARTPLDTSARVLAAMAGLAALSGDSQEQYLEYLAAQAHTLPLADPAPYWTAREVGTAASADSQLPLLQRHWAALVAELQRKGYLARCAPPPCTRQDPDSPPPEHWLDREVTARLGIPGLWSPQLSPGEWDGDVFLGLVEVVHDLVARPQGRRRHRHRGLPDCGWQFSDFNTHVGQRVYRWQVDRLLARHQVALRFAADGDDLGRLVRGTDVGREDLMERALGSPERADRDAVRHAVALFRAQAATRDDKRSAVVALARVLEDRRKLLKAELLSKDEGALFQIANDFDIRHRRPGQRPDYDDVYLDWVFWWYLATVELTDRLFARQP